MKLADRRRIRWLTGMALIGALGYLRDRIRDGVKIRQRRRE